MNRLEMALGRFAGMAMRGFKRPSSYRSNQQEVIRDNRQMSTWNRPETQNKQVIPIGEEETAERRFK